MIQLRRFEAQDQPLLVEYMNNPRVTRYLTQKIPSPYTEADAHWWVTEGGQTPFTRAITLSGKLIGCIGIGVEQFERSRTAELGYWLAEAYWGQGLMSEAIPPLVDEVFTETDVVRIYAPVFHPNIGSMRVLEKSGFTREAVHRQEASKGDQIYDVHYFVNLKPGVVLAQA